MTRLRTEWLMPIEASLCRWNERLVKVTGHGLAGLACRAVSQPKAVLAGKEAAVIPVTSGEGIIGHFADSICAVLRYLGMRAQVTGQTDVSGLYEASRAEADIAFMADDGRYIAVNMKGGRLAENDLCTAWGYRQLLEEACFKKTGIGLEGREVLLLGYGRVGKIMYRLLREKNAVVTVYDKDPAKQTALAMEGIPKIKEPEEMRRFRLIVDLTSEGSWMDPAWLHQDLIMAAPGVPVSLGEDVPQTVAAQVFHDDLELGTAVMAAYALKQEEAR